MSIARAYAFPLERPESEMDIRRRIGRKCGDDSDYELVYGFRRGMAQGSTSLLSAIRGSPMIFNFKSECR